MNHNTNPINDLPNNIKAYLNNKVDLLSLFIIKKFSQILPRLILGFIVAFTLLFFTLFISYSFIQWYADYIGKASTASLIVSGLYLGISIVLYVFRKQLIYNPIQKGIINGLDFKDIHKASNINKISTYEDLDNEIVRMTELSDKSDENINENINDIKEYYTFDTIKKRFIDDVFQNPKPAISLILQSILSISSIRRKQKEKRKTKE